MIHRERMTRPQHVYPTEEWRMVERRFYPRCLAQSETFFSTSNGYLGLRGSFEEGNPTYHAGTFINGFYESWPITYGEEAFGFAKTGQTIVNVTDSKIIKLYVDDESFVLTKATMPRFERALDMRSGTLDREILWETPSGKRISIKSRRLVSFQHRHLAAISYEVTVLNASAPVVISSEMINQRDNLAGDTDPRRGRGFSRRVLVPKLRYERDGRILLAHATNHSKLSLVCGIDHALETDCEHTYETKFSDDWGKVVFSVDAKPGVPIRLVKYMTYHTSRSRSPHELVERADRTLDRAQRDGFNQLLSGQREYLQRFWETSDVKVEGDPAIQQAIRFNLFHILQAAARAEGTGIPAKGLTGAGYEGHYFWDTEIYVLPFLVYTQPRIAKNLLKFRFGFLEQARERARQVNQKGALFPWRTINGEEASAYYAAGTAQYHINADIVYALRKYVEATGDEEFLYESGAEILVETARLWADLGFHSDRRDGRFCIHGVTGPDEYTTVVNNNTYTNLMARENLWYAAKTVRFVRDHQKERYAALVHETQLDDSEIDAWQRAADLMHLPFDEKTGIHPQDDNFLEKEPWDFAGTPPEKYPLLLHHHPLVIYRHQVIKQADVVLAMFLLGDEFSEEQKKRNFDFYDPLTTGDSSLSASIQAIMASEIGYRDKAREYARRALLMDLADVGGNVKDGCHIASMGGTWMSVVYGLAGMRDYDGKLTFRPRVPRLLDRVTFPLTVRGQQLQVDITREQAVYRLVEGNALEIEHDGQPISLTREQPEQVVELRLKTSSA